jgi:hypothetical protein
MGEKLPEVAEAFPPAGEAFHQEAAWPPLARSEARFERAKRARVGGPGGWMGFGLAYRDVARS